MIGRSGLSRSIAWRHLRVAQVPAWLPGLALRAVYLLLVGVGFLLASAPPPVELDEYLLAPSPDYAGLFGSLTLGTGALLLALCGLARVFNLLATIIVFSVAQGTMALVVVLGLMSGLEDDLRARLLDHRAHGFGVSTAFSFPARFPSAEGRPLSKDDCRELRLLLERQFDPVPKGRLRDAVRLVERYDISDLLGSAS